MESIKIYKSKRPESHGAWLMMAHNGGAAVLPKHCTLARMMPIAKRLQAKVPSSATATKYFDLARPVLEIHPRLLENSNV